MNRIDNLVIIGNLLYDSYKPGWDCNVLGICGVCYTLKVGGGGNPI